MDILTHFRRMGFLIALAGFAGLLMFLPAEANKSGGKQLLMVQAPSAAAQGIRTIQVQMLMNAPPAIVWNAMTQYDDFEGFLPGYQKSNILSSQGNVKMLDIALHPSPIAPVYRYQVRVLEQPQAYRLFFERTKGDLKFLKAQYQLTPRNAGKQTLVTYTLSIDPGPSLPGTNSVLKSHTEKSFYAMSSYVEELNHKSLIGQR